MARTGRPRGTDNKEVNYTLRLDDSSNKRLLAYCEAFGMTRSEAIREAIGAMDTASGIDFSKDESNSKQELVVFQDGDLVLDVPVNYEQETVWLTRNQMAELFDRDVKTIGKHIANALNEELDESVVAKFATTASDGKVYMVEHYNLDMILSVGYRVKSKRGIAFRRWANAILKKYLVDGYAINERRMAALQKTVEIQTKMLADTLNIEEREALFAVQQYTDALLLLDQYDHKSLINPKDYGRIGHR